MRPRDSLAALVLLAAACGGATTTSRVPLRPATAPAPSDVCSAADAADLMAARERAVVHGLSWLADFLEPPARLEVLGMDATSIFLEVGETAKSPFVRGLAMPLARREAARNLIHYLAPGGLDKHDDLMGAVSMLADADLLQIPREPLLSRVEEEVKSNATADELYILDLAHLDQASEDDLFWLLMDSYTMERAEVAFPGHFRLGFMLTDALRFFAEKPLVSYAADTSPNHQRFSDHAYLATHIGYVLQDYGRLELTVAQFGPPYDYIRAQFAPMLKLPDLELVAEFVDLFRSMGFGDDDRMVCAGTRFLLAQQRPDGSFSAWEKNPDPYGAVHATWVAVDALRDRDFQHDTPFARRLTEILASLHASR